MKKHENLALQLEELRNKFINRIVENDYIVELTHFKDNYFNIDIKIDDILFKFSVPEDLSFVCEYSSPIELFYSNKDAERKIAEIFFERNFEDVRIECVELEISELEMKLKNLKNESNII